MGCGWPGWADSSVAWSPGGSALFSPPGLYAGIKFFLIDFIFKRCPRLRAKYDTPYIVWRSLPTDPQLKERSGASVSRRVSRPRLGRRLPPHPHALPRGEADLFPNLRTDNVKQSSVVWGWGGLCDLLLCFQVPLALPSSVRAGQPWGPRGAPRLRWRPQLPGGPRLR